MRYISAFCFVVFSIFPGRFRVFSDHIVEVTTNSHWSSSGCGAFDVDDVFGAIRIAMIREPREVYLSIDFSWLEKILFEEKKVFVECIPLENLAGKVMPTYDEPINSDEEIFRIVYSPVVQGDYKPTPYTSGPIDNFLLKNPCWSILVRKFQRFILMPVCDEFLNLLLISA